MTLLRHVNGLCMLSAIISVVRSHGMYASLLQQVFQSVVISKLTYAAPAWWSFSTSADCLRFEDPSIKKIIKKIFQTAPLNGAMNYFDSAIRNGILSVHYQIWGVGVAETWGGAQK